MKREDLVKSRAYVTAGIQLSLLNLMEDYMKHNEINRTDLANQLNVSKGYITQVLNGDYDHKISKLVDLALSLNKMPIVKFVNLDEYIGNDANDKHYELFPTSRSGNIGEENNSITTSAAIKKKETVKLHKKKTSNKRIEGSYSF